MQYRRELGRGMGAMVMIYWVMTMINMVIVRGLVGRNLLGWELLGVIVYFLVITWWEITFIRALNQGKWDLVKGFKLSAGLLPKAIVTGLLASFIWSGGFLLFVIPVVVFSIWFMFESWEVALNERVGLLALKASRERVRGYFWPVLWRKIIAGLVSVFSLVAVIVTMRWLNSGWMYYLADGLRITILAALLPLIMVYFNLIYKQLGEIKGERKVEKAGGWKYLLVGLAGYGWTVFLALTTMGAAILFFVGKGLISGKY